MQRSALEASKAMVIENGVKPPSPRMGRGSAQQHLNPPPLQAVSLSAHARDSEEVSIPLEHGWPEWAPSSGHSRCDPEKKLTPKPTHPWHQVHRDEWESKLAAQLTHEWYKDHRHEQTYHFRKRNATILVKKAASQRSWRTEPSRRIYTRAEGPRSGI